MAKPPTSTRTVRLTDELWATIKADADARGEAVNAVIARHLRIAYAPKDKLTVGLIADVTLASPLGAKAMAKVNRGDGTKQAPKELADKVMAVSGIQSAVTIGYTRPKYGERQKKPKGKG